MADEVTGSPTPEADGPPTTITASGRTRYDLTRPVDTEVVVDGEEKTFAFDHVTLRRVKGKDMRWIEEVGAAFSAVGLVERLSGLPTAAIDEIDFDDMEALSTIVLGFMGRGRRTGRRASAS